MKRKLYYKTGHSPDYVFISLVLFLTIFGLIMLSSASSDRAKIKFNDTYYFLKHQIIYGLSLGLLGFFLTSIIHYRVFQKLAIIFLLFNLLLSILVFTPFGFAHTGAKRWITIGSLSLQPAELFKLTLILYLAAWLAPFSGKNKGEIRRKDFLAGFIPFLVICGVVGLLIIAQPATTTFFIIMSASLVVYFVSGARISYIIFAILLGSLIVGSIIFFTKDYRLMRIANFFNMVNNNQTQGNFHLNQALISIGSGGLWGVGWGKSINKFKFLPEPMTDSIFAIIAEELGFVGSVFLFLVILGIILRGLMIALKSRDQFARLVVVGFISIIAIQSFIHIAAISGVMPLTGVPLPFVSYGGTALAVFLTMSGIIVNISKYTSN
jgi:cell division protein FtsW